MLKTTTKDESSMNVQVRGPPITFDDRHSDSDPYKTTKNMDKSKIKSILMQLYKGHFVQAHDHVYNMGLYKIFFLLLYL